MNFTVEQLNKAEEFLKAEFAGKPEKLQELENGVLTSQLSESRIY